MPCFPLRKRPETDYHKAPLSFGSGRSGGARKHAGADLYAPVGTEILAIDDGTVVRGPYLFYEGTYAIDIRHPQGLVRYCEFSGAIGGLKVGDKVKCGQPIAKVGKLQNIANSMLHLELYSGSSDAVLTDTTRPPFMRRADLVDPTALLDSLPLLP